MNLSTQTNVPILTAKTCSGLNSRKVVYAFTDNSDFLFLDKKDIIVNQIRACERLLKYAENDTERREVEKEIDELKAAIDLLH